MSGNLILVYPMFAMVMVTLTVAVILFVVRVTGVRSQKVDPRYFKTYRNGEPTELMIKVERHFANLFEVPVLFYSGCTIAMLIPITGPVIQFWAWLFVIARVFHAAIHIGPNKLYPRITAFAVGLTAVFALWLQIFFAVA